MTDSVFDPRCKEIQKHKGVRFAAIINHNGEKIAGGFTEGVTPYEGNETKLHDFYKFALTVSLRTDELKNSLGALNYIASRRDKVILISFPFPVTTNILLISAEPGLDIENLAQNVVKIFSDSSGFTKTLADD
ncbi:MAG: hypothetical protein O3C04_00850 [Crenarchaeota archaeon]|nr:hypothetical protein [Thermoproteota archaeon]MDA1124180.1 hypothetical protein [Thermoproteota archaeon]